MKLLTPHRFRAIFFLAASLPLVPALVGCSGSSVTRAADSSLRLRIDWPAPTRLVPAASQSVRVDVTDSRGFQTFRVANRPISGTFSTVSFFGLAPGDASVNARAYPLADAQGVSVAAATSPVTLQSDTAADLQITLVSTIARLQIVPLTLARGASGTLLVTARDTNNALVPLTPSALRYESAATTIATVNASGIVTAVAAGTATITVTDSESSVSNTVDVVVNP